MTTSDSCAPGTQPTRTTSSIITATTSPRLAPRAALAPNPHERFPGSQDVAVFLTGQGIPKKITGLPEDAMDSPLGKLIRPLIENMERMLKGISSPSPWRRPSLG